MIRFGALTETGRRQNNEDRAVATRYGNVFLFGVADGLGGHPAGDVASEVATRVITGHLSTLENPGSRDLLDAVFAADQEIARQSMKNSAWSGMGTTLSACLVDAGCTGSIVNVGDSRTYVIDGGIWHTRDQSLVQTLVDRGEITAEMARRHPLNNIVLQALGNPGRRLAPDIYSCGLTGKFLLLSTDGLHDWLEEAKIARIVLESAAVPEACCKSLVKAALTAGSPDNITVVVVKIE